MRPCSGSWSFTPDDLKVVVAIHLEAVKLLSKGLRLRPAPPDPGLSAVTAGHGEPSPTRQAITLAA